MRLAPIWALLVPLALTANAAAQMPKDLHGDPLPKGAVARLGTLRFQPRHPPSEQDELKLDEVIVRFLRGGHAADAALSPDGTALAVCDPHDKRSRIDFMDTATGKIRRTLKLKDMYGDPVGFTPDGKRLVLAGYSEVALVNAVSGSSGPSIQIKAFEIGPVAVSPYGKWVAAQPQVSAYDAPVRIWDATSGKEIASLPGRGASCRGLMFGPDAKRLLLWSTVPTHADGKGMSFNGKDKVALVCIDIEKRKIIGEATITTSQQAALSPDGETVAIEDAKHDRVRIRHLPTGAERCVISVKSPKLAFAPDGKVLLTIDIHGWGALWDAAKGTKIRDLDGALANADYQIVGFSQDGKTIAILDGGWHSDPVAVIWNAGTGKRAERPPGHNGTVTCLAYAPGGKLLASGSIDRTVRLWNAVTGEHLRTLAEHNHPINAVAFSADGKLMASASHEGEVRVSAVADGKQVASFITGLKVGATTLAFSADSKRLLTGGTAPEVLTWDIASGKEVARLFTEAGGSVMALADGGSFALSGHFTFRGFGEGDGPPERMQLWNPLKKEPMASMSLYTDKRGSARCDAATFSPDGRLVASSQISEYQGIRPSYGAAMLRVWERASGQPIRTLAPSVTKLVGFSRDGRLLAAGGEGKPGHLRVGYGAGIDIWDVLTGKKAGSLAVSPECLAFSPDGLHLATGGRDHCVLIWKAPQLKTPENAPSAKERAAWWDSIGNDAKTAYPAMAQMLGDPEPAVALLKERLKPVQLADRAVATKRIAELDSDDFNLRIQAEAELKQMGEGAADFLAEALERKPTLELRRRLESLLRECEALSTTGLRHQRAVATLEWIATPAARAFLETLAQGAPRAHLTTEARAALKRLKD